MPRPILTRFELLALVIAMTACASSTSVLRTGQDKFTVTVPLFAGGQLEATTEASDFCERYRKKLFPLYGQQLADNGPGQPPAYSMTFRCNP
jgi:hypothetical protein